jgi:hypothetical protein
VGLSSSDLRLRVLADLVEQVLSEPLYDTLRTKQQLGYTVSSGTRLTHGVTGFCVVVVSAAFEAPEVERRIEAFLDDYQKTTLQVCAVACLWMRRCMGQGRHKVTEQGAHPTLGSCSLLAVPSGPDGVCVRGVL